MVHTRPQTYSLQRLARKILTRAAIDLRETERQFHVFRQRHAGDQIERLKNHAHNVQPVLGQFFARKLCQITILHNDASRRRTIESCDKIQHGRFA